MPATSGMLRVEDARWFVEALGDLPPDRWLRAAASASCDGPARSCALTAVRELLEDDGAALEAWYLADEIETAAWCRLRSAPGSPARRRAVEAARAAALAVLVRRRLAERWFSVLYEPFATVVPLNRPRMD